MNETNQTSRRLSRVRKLVIRVPADIAADIRADAMAQGMSMNTIVNLRLRATTTTQQKAPFVANSLAAKATNEADEPANKRTRKAHSLTGAI